MPVQVVPGLVFARALPQNRSLGGGHRGGVGLLDVPLVQTGQAHRDALAAEAHTAFPQGLAAGVEGPCPGQCGPQLLNNGGVDARADEYLGAVQLVPQAQ